MTEVTQLLQAIEQGEVQAAERLLPLVYEELRRLAAQMMASEQPGQTLQPTALVHEAYMRLVVGEDAKDWKSRRYFFAAAAQAMRRILVDSARRKGRLKRGGDRQRVDWNEAAATSQQPPSDLVALDEALTRLAAESPLKARLVELRFFAGMSVEEAAAALEIAPITAKRHWRYARAWLHRELSS